MSLDMKDVCGPMTTPTPEQASATEAAIAPAAALGPDASAADADAASLSLDGGPRAESLLQKLAQPKTGLLMLLGLALLLLLPGLTSFGLWDPYEVRLLETSQESFSLRQLWQPEQSFKPRLPMVPIVMGTKLLGLTELGGRAPMVVLALLTLGALWQLGRVLQQQRAATLGGLALLTMPAFFLSARQVSLTLLPVLGQTLAMAGLAALCWPRSSSGRSERVGGGLLALLGLTIGLLSSGALVGLAAPLLAMTVALLITGGPQWAQLGVAGAAGLALAMPSRVILQLAHASSELRLGLCACLLVVTAIAARAGRLRRGAWLGLGTFAVALLPRLGELTSAYSPWLGGLGHWPPGRETQIDSLLRPLGFQLFPWSALLPLALSSVFAYRAKVRTEAAPPSTASIDEAADGTTARTEFALLLPVCWFASVYFFSTLQGALVAEAAVPALVALALLTGLYLERLLLGQTGAPIAAGLCVALLMIILGRDLFFMPEQYLSGQLTETLRWPPPLSEIGQIMSTTGLVLGVVFGVAIGARHFRRRGLAVALGLSLVTALACIHGLMPAVTKHVSYRGIYTKYQRLGGGALGVYGVQQSGSKIYGQNSKTLGSLNDLLAFLTEAPSKRAFAIVGSGELAALDQAAHERKQPYFVVDDTNSQFLLVSNQLSTGESDLNPLRRLISDHAPTPKHVVSAVFEDRIELLGYDLPDEIKRGEEVTIRLYYKTLQPVTGSYKVFLHFDGAGSRWNGDHIPNGGKFPTSYWAAGTYITDEHRVTTSRLAQAAGYYQILTGFWPGGDGARMRVTQGAHEPDHRVKLGIVRVK